MEIEALSLAHLPARCRPTVMLSDRCSWWKWMANPLSSPHPLPDELSKRKAKVMEGRMRAGVEGWKGGGRGEGSESYSTNLIFFLVCYMTGVLLWVGSHIGLVSLFFVVVVFWFNELFENFICLLHTTTVSCTLQILSFLLQSDYHNNH